MEYLGNCPRERDFKLLLHMFYHDIFQPNKNAIYQMLMYFKEFLKKEKKGRAK